MNSCILVAMIALFLLCLGTGCIRLHMPAVVQYGRRKGSPANPVHCRTAAKPDWVRVEILRLRALMPDTGCRKLALCFNRRFAHRGMTVGKTYVSTVIRAHEFEIRVIRQKIRNRNLAAGVPNRIWGLDLTGKTDRQGQLHFILGLVDHGTRANLMLRALNDKSSLTLIRVLLDVIERFGKPRTLRTDNEGIFASRLFRLSLWLLGIRHQRTDPHCPWQNGRIERFFGTLKQKLDRWTVVDLDQLNHTLRAFRLWYNHVRPHQHLAGRTPAEVWDGVDIHTRPPKEATWFTAWEGLLTGYYLLR